MLCVSLRVQKHYIEIRSQFRTDFVFSGNMGRTRVAVGQESLSDNSRCRTDVVLSKRRIKIYVLIVRINF